MRLYKHIYTLLHATILAFWLTSHVQATCSKKLAVSFFDIEVEYDKVGKLLKPSHVDLLMVKEILSLAKCDYSLTKLPWARMATSIEHGQIDLTLAASFSEERAKISHLSAPYRYEKIRMVMRLNEIHKFQVTNFRDIMRSNKNIGIRLGVWYGKKFHEAHNNNDFFRSKVLRAAGHGGLLDWLMLKRVDILFYEEKSAWNEINRTSLQQKIGVHPFLVHQGSIHIMLSRATTTEQDLATINNAIREFKRTESYNQLEQHFSDSPNHSFSPE